MMKFNKIHVFRAFNPYFRVLQACNAENYMHKNQIDTLKGISFAIGVIIFIALLPTLIASAIWI